MLNDIIREARRAIWEEARASGVACNPMHPDEHLDAYCLVRNLQRDPYLEWYDEVVNHSRAWSRRANDAFVRWTLTRSRLVDRYVFPISRRPVNGVVAANINQSTPQWYNSTVLVMGVQTDPEKFVSLECLRLLLLLG